MNAHVDEVILDTPWNATECDAEMVFRQCSKLKPVHPLKDQSLVSSVNTLLFLLRLVD